MGQEFTTFIGEVHYRNAAGASLFARAAAWCVDRAGFDEAVSTHLEAEGGALLWSEDVFSVVDWLGKFGHNSGVMALARKVSDKTPVAMSEGKAEAGAADDDFLVIEEIEGVEPLDAQMGIWPKLTVPAALQEAMFGEPEPTAADRAEYGDAVPPMRTYAILDAAKLPYILTANLENSGLEYQSLFQGEAQEDLGEYAPYIVRLEEGNDFSRLLFTRKSAAGLWEDELGIFVRSRASLADLRKHFRKFTRVQDENGKWYYFRFWEGASFRHYLLSCSTYHEKIDQLFGADIAVLLTFSTNESSFCQFKPKQVVTEAGRFTWDDRDKYALKKYGEARFIGSLQRQVIQATESEFDKKTVAMIVQKSYNFVRQNSAGQTVKAADCVKLVILILYLGDFEGRITRTPLMMKKTVPIGTRIELTYTKALALLKRYEKG